MSEPLDRLAKLLAGGGSRRDALKYLGGLLAGGFLAGLTGRARADDDKDKDDDDDQGDDDEGNSAINKACRAFCKTCPRRPEEVRERCSRRCKRFLRKNPTGTLCGTCTATNPFTGCVAGATCCPATATAAAFCTNTQTDAKNCGKCGNACPTANPDCCAGACTNTQTDAKNCGACGNVCPAATPNCVKGVCSK